MVDLVPFRRVVLIADVAVEDALLEEIERLGFVTYTSTHCVGRTSHGVVDDPFVRGVNYVRIEALGSTESAEELMQFVQQGVLSHYSITCYRDVVEASFCASLN